MSSVSPPPAASAPALVNPLVSMPASKQFLAWQNVYKNSVALILVDNGLKSPDKPYRPPHMAESRGSGFFIDESHIMTNHHVVASALGVRIMTHGTGDKQFEVEVVATVPEKDIALLRLNRPLGPDGKVSEMGAIEAYNGTKIVAMPFGDDYELSHTDEVMAIGYPLGHREIKFTNGTVSGFHQTAESSDRPDDKVSYIQITAAINPGNSGGPLINIKGQVVGINAAGYMFSQSVAFAIPSRVVLSELHRMAHHLPTGSRVLRASRLPVDIVAADDNLIAYHAPQYSTQNPDVRGMHVFRIHPGYVSPAKAGKGFELNDIIVQLKTQGVYIPPDSFSNSRHLDAKGRFDKVERFESKDKRALFETVTVSKGSYIQLSPKNPYDVTKRRNISMQEIVRSWPIGTPIEVTVLRKDKLVRFMHTLASPFETFGVQRVYEPWEKYDYEIIAGMNFSDMTENHLYKCDEDLSMFTKGKRKDKKWVIMTYIFSSSSAATSNMIHKRSILSKLNGQDIHTVEDLRRVLSEIKNSSSEYLNFSFFSGKQFSIKLSKAKTEDMQLHTIRQISPTPFHFQLYDLSTSYLQGKQPGPNSAAMVFISKLLRGSQGTKGGGSRILITQGDVDSKRLEDVSVAGSAVGSMQIEQQQQMVTKTENNQACVMTRSGRVCSTPQRYDPVLGQ